MRLRSKVTLFVSSFLGLVLLFNLVKYHNRTITEATSPILKGEEHEKIIVDTRTKTVTVVTKSDDTKTNTSQQQVKVLSEGERQAVITEDNQGHLSVYSPKWGYVFEPGECIFYSDTFRIGLDTQWFYWQRYGVITGLGINFNNNQRRNIDGFIAVSYNLPFETFSNTSIYTGYSFKQQLVVGGRVKF